MPDFLRLAEEALDREDFSTAAEILEEHLQSNPLDVHALSLKCFVEVALDRFDMARETAERIANIDSNSFEFHQAMGAVLTDDPSSPKEMGTIRRAIDHMEEAIRIADSRPSLTSLVRSGLHYNLANARHQLYRSRRVSPRSSLADILDAHSDAMAAFDAALKANPESVDAWVNKGNLLDEAGRYIESLDCYGEALRLNPKHSMARGNRGVALARLASDLPDQYRNACLREAGFFLRAAMSAGEFRQRCESDVQLNRFVASIFELDRFEDAEIVVAHFLTHARSTGQLPRGLGKAKPPDFRRFADAITKSYRLRLAFSEDFLLQSSTTEEWVDFPSFLSQMKHLPADTRVFVVALIDRYRTARNLLVLSLASISEFDVLSAPDRPGFPSFSMNEEMLKDALKTAVDLLDSVAHLLVRVCGYHPQGRITFGGPNSLFFKTTVFEDNRENQQLLAIASLSREISRGEYIWLDGFRNARTHEYLLFRSTIDPVGQLQGTDEYHLVGTDEFLEKAVKGLRITRAAILYTVLFVFGLESEEEGVGVPAGRDSD